MARAVFVVYSEPSTPEREDEYNDWYDNTHLGEVCATPGFTGAFRYRLTGDAAPAGLPPYLAIYEIDSDDPEGSVKEMVQRSMAGEIRISDALKLDPAPVTALYTAL
jgi:hypothetical protein